MIGFVWRQTVRILGKLYVSQEISLPAEGSLAVGGTTVKLAHGDTDSHPALSRLAVGDGVGEYVIPLLTHDNQLPGAHLAGYVKQQDYLQLLQRVAALEQFVSEHFS